MDFSASEEQIALRDQAAEFARNELNGELAGRDRRSEFLRENWVKCAEFGIQGLFVPRKYGGGGKDLLTTVLILEGLGYGCLDNGLTLALNGQIWTVQRPIQAFGTDEQKERFLAPFASGESVGAHAMTEPDSGSDAYALKTHAEKRSGGYVLNGSKMFIGLASVADVALVFATVNPELGKWGITAFLVDKRESGFRASPVREKMGLRTVPIGELVFEDCFVPEANVLGRVGAGVSLFNATTEWERGFIFSSHVGSMERQLDAAIGYAKERRQFGQPIGKFESASSRIADMKLRLETAKLLLYKTAWLKQQGRSAAIESAMTKLHVSESFVESSLDSVRLHGGRGYLSEFEVERDLRDSTGGVIYAGTSDIQRLVIARLLGL